MSIEEKLYPKQAPGLAWEQLDNSGHEWVQYVVKRTGNCRWMGAHCNRCGGDYSILFGRHERHGADVSCQPRT